MVKDYDTEKANVMSLAKRRNMRIFPHGEAAYLLPNWIRSSYGNAPLKLH